MTLRVYKYRSKSSDAIHVTTVFPDGHATCSCIGFKRGCWHIADARAKAEQGIEPDEVTDPTRIDGARFIDPMLAKALKEGRSIDEFCSSNFVMEEKFDGHRMQVIIDESGIQAFARSGNERTLPKHIVDMLRFVTPGTYDGELLVVGGTSTDVTALDLQNNAQLVLFDIMRDRDDLVIGKEFRERRELLEAALDTVFRKGGDQNFLPVEIAQSMPVTESGLQEIWDRGGEGAIVKNIYSVYQIGRRSSDWIKFKRQQTAELTIIGFQAGKLGPHSKIRLRDDEGVEISVKTLNDEWRADFSVDPLPYVGRRLVISFQEKTRDGKYRHPMADHFV